jgi:hypothetical protein
MALPFPDKSGFTPPVGGGFSFVGRLEHYE